MVFEYHVLELFNKFSFQVGIEECDFFNFLFVKAEGLSTFSGEFLASGRISERKLLLLLQ